MNATAERMQFDRDRTSSAAADFGARQILGVVQSMRRTGDDSWVILTLDGGRVATGDVGESDGEINLGVSYRFFGAWTHHERYGDQFKFQSFTVSDRQGQMGVIAYLSRSQLGLTKAGALRVWSVFGADSIDAIRDRPDDVVRECRFPEAVISKVYAASEILRESGKFEDVKVQLYELFANHGFRSETVKACVARWGMNAARFGCRADLCGRPDPFRMLVNDIPGVGFKMADKLYLATGGNPNALRRQMLAAWHAMRVSGTGNTWERDGVLNRAIFEATGGANGADGATAAIRLGLRSGWIVRKIVGDVAASLWDDSDAPLALQTWYAESANAAAEARLAKQARRIRGHAALWPAVTVDELADDHQRGKLAEIAGSALAVLAGTPGTGKTFVAATLIRLLLRDMPAGRIAVCAPTGKAAVRITEALRKNGIANIQATTIHQLLQVDGNTHDRFVFQRNEERPLDASVVIADEYSMTDTDLAAALFAAVPPGGNVLLVGDPYQLPPVGHGAPLRDMMAAGVPCAMLTEIKRNDGLIVRACKQIKDGGRFETVDSPRLGNLVHIPASSEQEQLAAIMGLLGAVRARGYDPVWDCQVICVTNDKGMVSRKPLNEMIQAVLNPATKDVPESNRNALFRPGDKAICLKNSQVSLWKCGALDDGKIDESRLDCYRKTPVVAYVANGDVGRVMAVDRTSAVVKFMLPERLARPVTGKAKKSGADGNGGTGGAGGDGAAGDKVQFDLAYAITIHKSQGSEVPIAIVVIDEAAGQLGCRELIYTAISRASGVCFLVGNIATAWRWAARATLQARKTFLRELIQDDA